MLNFLMAISPSYALDGFGGTVQIHTELRKFTGRPSWLLIIRDIDNGANIPYIFDFETGDNDWFAFSPGRNYLILASTMHFSPSRYNPYGEKIIRNFCNIESNGQILRGQHMFIRLKGNLSPNRNTYSCIVTRSAPAAFYVVSPGKE